MERNKIIIKTSIIGIITNILLASFKAIVGFFVNSIAIILDAVNNLTDAISSIVTIVGTKLSSKKPDKDHPYGHGRIEYFASIIIAVIILYAGITSGKESLMKIIKPENTNYSIISLIIIFIAVLVKFFLSRYFNKKGNDTNSQSLIASSKDALMDAVLSLAILISSLANYLWHLNIEGYLGALIAILIIKSAVEILKETINYIIGSRADKSFSTKLKKEINSFSEVQGVFDLNLHNYGPSKIIASVHIQVRNDMTAEEIHILTREIEYKIFAKYGIAMTIGIYAANDSGDFGEIKEYLNELIKKYPSIIEIHGFYVDEKNKNVYFDVIFDFNEENKDSILKKIVKELKLKYNKYNYNVIIDSDITD